MYFGLSEEQKSLEESINKYLESNASLDTIKAVADGDQEKAEEIHQGLVGLGISGIRYSFCCSCSWSIRRRDSTFSVCRGIRHGTNCFEARRE